MAMLHIGTFNAEAVIELLPKAQRCTGVPGSPSEWRFVTNGDNWEEWGEGRPADDPRPELLIALGDAETLLVDVGYVIENGPGLLVPMTYPNQRGYLACITKESDESEPIYEVKSTPAERFIRDLVGRNPDLDPYSLWTNPEWLAWINPDRGDDVVSH